MEERTQHTSMLRTLVNVGIDINIQDKTDGNTALHSALILNKPEAVSIGIKISRETDFLWSQQACRVIKKSIYEALLD